MPKFICKYFEIEDNSYDPQQLESEIDPEVFA